MARKSNKKSADGRSKWFRRGGKGTPAKRNNGRKSKNGRKGAAQNTLGSSSIPQSALEKKIDQIPSMKLTELPSLVQQCGLPENIDLQRPLLVKALTRILKAMHPTESRTPFTAQIRTLNRLIFGRGDTLLIAKTGFGKSLILHAFSILTGQITLQIIPLNRLGDEQFKDISSLSGCRPCLLNSESKKEQKGLITKIKNLEFTHILLGPEQASSPIFREALMSSTLQSRIGLIAIDECHLIEQWESFRPAFTMLGELRHLLRQDIVWFGCSASVTVETEKRILERGGFRELGDQPYQTEIIRTSVDRPDISISASPIPRGKLTSFESLYFLLDQAWDDGPTPMQIPKTILFIDSRTDIRRATAYLQNALLGKMKASGGEPRDEMQDYSTLQNSPFCVSNIIQFYTALVAEYDKEKRYAEFKSPESRIRIMVATTAVGIGINIPDVDRIGLWKFGIDYNISEYWQRMGRGGRGQGRTSHALLFIPYWAFDSQGQEPPAVVVAVKKPALQARGNKSQTSGRPVTASRLSSSINAEDVSDTESVHSVESTASQADPSLPSTFGRTQRRNMKRKQWTKLDLKNRAELPDIWRAICNGPCRRLPFLSALGEEQLLSAQRPEVDKQTCCDKCNPLLSPVLTPAPEIDEVVAKPRVNTLAGFAMEQINHWALKQAEELFPSPYRRVPIPPAAIIPTTIIHILAHLYGQPSLDKAWWENLTVERLEQKVKLSLWPDRSENIAHLVDQMRLFYATVQQKMIQFDQTRKAERIAAAAAKKGASNASISSQAIQRESLQTITDIDHFDQRRDYQLARQVAEDRLRQRMLREGNGTDMADFGENILAQVRAKTSGVEDFLASIPASTQELTTTPRNTTPELSQSNDLIPETQPNESIPETQYNDDLVDMQTRDLIPETQYIDEQSTPKRRRVIGRTTPEPGLGFSPVSRSGRKRTMTPKGRENFIKYPDI